MSNEPPTKIPLDWDYTKCVMCAEDFTNDNQQDEYVCIACHNERRKENE